MKSPTPVLRFDSATLCGSCTLGGEHASRHVAIESPFEVASLFQQAFGECTVVGSPPTAGVLAVERFRVVESEYGYSMSTTSYKHILLYKSDSAQGWMEGSSALRFESESKAGYNSWILNHPIHHLHPGDSKAIRVPLLEHLSITGFIDWVIRSFDDSIWANMYPELYSTLTIEGGVIFERIGSIVKGSIDISEELQEMLRQIIAAGRADQTKWYKELKLWQNDTGGQSNYVPELFMLFKEIAL